MATDHARQTHSQVTPRTRSATTRGSRCARQAIKSSAMRDLMSLAERPDVISLAGGFPDTASFPKEVFAKS